MERFLTSRVLMCETSRSETYFEMGVSGSSRLTGDGFFASQLERKFLQSEACVPLLLVPSNKPARPVKAYLVAEKNQCYGMSPTP